MTVVVRDSRGGGTPQVYHLHPQGHDGQGLAQGPGQPVGPGTGYGHCRIRFNQPVVRFHSGQASPLNLEPRNGAAGKYASAQVTGPGSEGVGGGYGVGVPRSGLVCSQGHPVQADTGEQSFYFIRGHQLYVHAQAPVHSHIGSSGVGIVLVEQQDSARWQETGVTSIDFAEIVEGLAGLHGHLYQDGVQVVFPHH